MRRFYCDFPDGPLDDWEAVELDAEQTKHAVRVLRLGVDDEIELCDGRGRVASAWITALRPRAQVRCREISFVPRPKPALTVAAAIPKGSHAEAMVSGLSQVGVDVLVPVLAARSAVRPGDGKLERLRRVAEESVKQCGRAHAMALTDARRVDEVLEGSRQLALLAVPDAAGARAERAIANPVDTTILIGPEGGWTHEEMQTAESAGALPWSCGDWVMRIEVAALVAAGIVRQTWRGVLDSPQS